MKSSHKSLRLILLAQAGAGIALTFGFAGAWWLRANGLTVSELGMELKRGDEPRYEWKSIDGKHWQANAGIGEATAVTDAREANGAGCAPGMVRVRGAARVERFPDEIERLQDTACTDWISKEFPARCRTFDEAKIAESIASLPVKPYDYCIDRFEYPNVQGEYPMIVFTFHEAESSCKKGGKRLCTESEWTFACEGEEARPYPYGYGRDATACVVDRNWRPFTEGALLPRNSAKAKNEIDRLWQAEPSGTRGGCKSPFGVYDLTGNVDEWTRSVRSTGFSSVLKGGYWGPVRARCRPSTRAHNEDFIDYQESFRCCGESNQQVAAPKPAPPVAHVGDASAPAKVSSLPAGGAPVADLPANEALGWDEDGDELRAIKRARASLACDASPVAPGSSQGYGAFLALGVVVVASARRRRRAR